MIMLSLKVAQRMRKDNARDETPDGGGIAADLGQGAKILKEMLKTLFAASQRESSVFTGKTLFAASDRGELRVTSRSCYTGLVLLNVDE
ncbi:hypothetical protein BDR22DRAFT_258183 [Usnea florida]